MNRKNELVRNTMILTIGKVCTQFISFLLLPLYTSILNTSEYGVVDLFATYVALLLPIVSWQFDQGIFRFMIDARNEKSQIKSIYSNVVVMNVIQNMIFLIVYLICRKYVSSEFKDYLLVNVILNVFSGTLMQFARGLGQMMTYAIGSFITASSTVVFNVIYLVIFKWGAHGLFRATITALIINILYLAVSIKVWRYFDIHTLNKKIVKNMSKYTLPLVPNQISGWILSASDRSIITGFLGLTYNGIYAVAYKFPGIISTFYGFFNMAWVETVALHFKDADRDEFFTETVHTVLGFFISVCNGIIAIMPFLFPVIVNEKYSDAYYQIPILLVAVIFQIIVGLLSAVYLALKKSAVIARTTIFGAVINIVVHIILIKWCGLYAASISTLISYMSVALYRSVDVKKYIGFKWNKTFILKTLLSVSVVLFCYYENTVILNIVSVSFAFVFAIYINKDIVTSIIRKVVKLTKYHK